MADRKTIKPLATLGDLVIVDYRGLAGDAKPTRPAIPLSRTMKREGQLDPEKARPGKLLSRQELLDVVRKVPKLELKESPKPASDLRLSPQRPFISGRGSLMFFRARMVSSSGDFAYFTHEDPGETFTEAWLYGLEQGGSYLAQMRVSAPTGGHFRIRGSDTGSEILFGSGHEKTIIVVMQDLTYDMSLLIVETVGLYEWTFHDLTVTPL